MNSIRGRWKSYSHQEGYRRMAGTFRYLALHGMHESVTVIELHRHLPKQPRRTMGWELESPLHWGRPSLTHQEYRCFGQYAFFLH